MSNPSQSEPNQPDRPDQPNKVAEQEVPDKKSNNNYESDSLSGS